MCNVLDLRYALRSGTGNVTYGTMEPKSEYTAVVKT